MAIEVHSKGQQGFFEEIYQCSRSPADLNIYWEIEITRLKI